MNVDEIILSCVLVWWIIFFLTRPVRAAARCGILRKAGLSWWKGLLPFYGEYLQYRISWKTDWYWFHLLSVGGRLFCYLFFAQGVLYRANHYTHKELMGMVLLSLPDVVFALIGLCARYLAMEHLAQVFGKSKRFALGLYLLPSAFLLYLGFCTASYENHRGEIHAKEKAFPPVSA